MKPAPIQPSKAMATLEMIVEIIMQSNVRPTRKIDRIFRVLDAAGAIAPIELVATDEGSQVRSERPRKAKGSDRVA
jgi:hypothetical protein